MQGRPEVVEQDVARPTPSVPARRAVQNYPCVNVSIAPAKMCLSNCRRNFEWRRCARHNLASAQSRWRRVDIASHPIEQVAGLARSLWETSCTRAPAQMGMLAAAPTPASCAGELQDDARPFDSHREGDCPRRRRQADVYANLLYESVDAKFHYRTDQAEALSIRTGLRECPPRRRRESNGELLTAGEQATIANLRHRLQRNVYSVFRAEPAVIIVASPSAVARGRPLLPVASRPVCGHCFVIQ